MASRAAFDRFGQKHALDRIGAAATRDLGAEREQRVAVIHDGCAVDGRESCKRLDSSTELFLPFVRLARDAIGADERGQLAERGRHGVEHRADDRLGPRRARRLYEEQRAAWEEQYAKAHARWEAHVKQQAEAKAAEAEAGEATSYSSGADAAAETETGGSLASDEALQALREKLTGGN